MIKNFDKNIFFVKNKDFHTIQIKLVFPFYDAEEDMAHLTLLPSLLSYSNKVYNTEESFQKNKQRKYILSTGCGKTIIGTNVFFTFSMIVPDIKSLGKDLLEEQFDFFEKMIYYPKVVDEQFDSFDLEREKKDLKVQISNGLKNLGVYQSIKVVEAFDTEGSLSRGIYKNPQLIDLVTTTSLYSYYKEKIYNNSPLVFVFGDCDEEQITKLINKYIIKNDINISYKKDFCHYLQPRDEVFIVNDKGDFKDSSISLIYKVKDMKEDEEIILGLLSSLLSSGSSRLLQKVLRDENDLVYSSKSCGYLKSGALEITAYINKNNKDIAIKKIEEVVESLNDENFISEFLNNIIDRRRLNLKRLLDDKYGLLDEVIGKELGFDMLSSELFEIAKKVTPSEIVNFVNRLVLDTIYFIEGEEHE